MKYLMVATICISAIHSLLAVHDTNQADERGQDCVNRVTKLNAFLMSDSAISGEIQLITKIVCPDLDDPKGCEADVQAWWGKVARAMFEATSTAREICLATEVGAWKSSGQWNCEECKRLVTSVGGVIASDESLKTVTDFLGGDGFCHANPDVCALFVDALMPKALPIFGESIALASQALCLTVFGQCA